MKHIILAAFGLSLSLAPVFAQYDNDEKADIKVRKIDVSLVPAPRYLLQSSSPASDPTKKWLVVDADLLVAPEWADEITLKFYVATFYGPNVKENVPEGGYDVLSATVTIANVQRNVGTGRKAIVPVFLDANTVKKYEPSSIDKFVQDVVVQAYYKGVLQSTKWMKNPDNGRFWEKKQPRNGLLLNFLQSPWYPAYVDHYEQVKPSTTATGP